MSDGLEALRKKKLAEIKQQANQQQNQEEQLKAEIGRIELLVKRQMTKEAVSRYSNIKLTHPDLALSVLGVLVNVLEKKREGLVTDDELKRLLIMLNQGRKKEFNIMRK